MSKTESLLKKSPLYSALILESLFSAKKRRLLIKIIKYLLFSIPIIIIIGIIFSNANISGPNAILDLLITKLLGVILILVAIYIYMHMFEAYFISIYYFDYITKNKYSQKELYTFTAGRILYRVEADNILTGLLKSQGVGKKIIKRLGITDEEASILLMKQSEVTNPPVFNPDNLALVKILDIADFIYKNHSDFRNLLTSHGINQNDLEATIDWVVYNTEKKEYDRQWWLKENLARIHSLASDWSFGKTFHLNKFSRDLLTDEETISETTTFSGREREVEKLQSVLTRPTNANAILIGLPGQEKMEVVWSLCQKIKTKNANLLLAKKRPVLFLTSIFSSSIDNKGDFEREISKIFNEVISAGNIILVIDNLPKLILQAKQFELKLYEIIAPFLSGTNIQIIALADTEYFHTLIEPDQAIMSSFEIIMTKALTEDEIIKIIGREAFIIEKTYEILFTYQAIFEIAKSAEKYFPDGVSSDKAEDLLAEIAPWAVKNGLEIIGKDEVLKYVGEKLDIPISSISIDEKDKLLNLENLLMKRIVAQREAIFSISSAIRRGRAGIRNEKRPLGSFLFLGPTGVGKTETAKALADVFFGDEKLLLRLDMSEYQNEESLARLIGSREANTQGILSNMLREHPYGVLLLDEFEKTNKNVLNLFLQIIDEGYFSDATGKKVMARNIMFIATSNAGAEKIFEIVNTGKKLESYENEIINDIVKNGIFKPELLNRFDSSIIFQPLTKENLSEIAVLILKKVANRLSEKGITLSINKDLIDFIVSGGYNPTFGARPMNRLIQDTVEQHLADLIIRGDLFPGKTISFTVISNESNKDSLKPVII